MEIHADAYRYSFLVAFRKFLYPQSGAEATYVATKEFYGLDTSPAMGEGNVGTRGLLSRQNKPHLVGIEDLNQSGRLKTWVNWPTELMLPRTRLEPV